MERSVIHINVVGFAIAVERQLDCRLKGRPVVIAPANAPRTPVYDMSEEAFLSGIRKGMPVSHALKMCRECQVLPLHPARYELAMNTILKHARDYTPMIERGHGDGHLFLDVTGTSRLFGPPPDVAWRLEKQVKKEFGMAPVWSVAPNKLVAKVATRLVKPIGEYIVWPGEEEPLFTPLPLYLIPGVEKTDLTELAGYHISKVSELKAWNRAQLEVSFGNRAGFLHDSIRGIDLSPVISEEEKAPSLIMDHTFSEDTNRMSDMEAVLYALCEKSGKKLREKRRFAGICGMTIDYSDGLRCSRQVSVNPPTANDPALFQAARRALSLAVTRRIRVNHIRLSFRKLLYPPLQMDLFEHRRHARENALSGVVDKIRQKFGDAAIYPGRMSSSDLQQLFYA